MGSTGPFLLNAGTHQVTTFNGKKTFTIGRSVGTDLDIPCKFISRTQCKIELRDDVWVLYDQSRFRTTKVNGSALKEEYILLNDGDKISFSAGGPEYLFYSDELNCPPVSKKRKAEHFTTELCSNDDDYFCSPIAATQISPNTVSSLNPIHKNDDMLCATDDECFSGPITTTQICPNSVSSLNPIHKNEDILKLKSENEALVSEIKLIKENADIIEMSLSAMEAEKKMLEGKLAEVESLATTSNEKLESVLSEMRDLKTESKEYKMEYEKLSEKVLQLKSDLAQKHTDLKKLEEDLSDAQGEMDRLLEERCCKILNFKSSSIEDSTPKNEDNSNSQSYDLISTVEIELLRKALDDITTKYKQQAELISSYMGENEAMSKKIMDIIDSELYCTICSELLYQATSLNCRHTFCKVCIEEWKKKKKDCPVCRTRIKTEVCSLVIDSLVDKISEYLGGEIKSRRDELKQERNTIKPKTPRPSTSRRGRGNRARNMDPLMNMIGIAREILSPSFAVTTLTEHFHQIPPQFIDLTENESPIRRRNTIRGRRNNR